LINKNVQSCFPGMVPPLQPIDFAGALTYSIFTALTPMLLAYLAGEAHTVALPKHPRAHPPPPWKRRKFQIA
jgi:hypothetical protein